MTTLRITQLTGNEISLAIDWAAAEGWNPGLHDAACFAAADPAGFFAGWIDDVPVATISVVKYGATFAFLGLYIVKPAYRGRGYGLALWNHALATAHGRTVGLDGVVAQQDNYKRSGFALAYRNIRYGGVRGADAPLDARVVPLSRFAFGDVVRYDRAFFPEPRDEFLRCWIAQPDAKAMAVEQRSGIAGYGVIRPSRNGFKLGPLFADDASCAEALFQALATRVPAGAAIFLDVPEPNVSAIALAERHGMSPVFETARMYAGQAPKLPLAKLFGVTTFELG
jgi:ribosomal protein S18 acetylase RimI-like enzyme